MFGFFSINKFKKWGLNYINTILKFKYLINQKRTTFNKYKMSVSKDIKTESVYIFLKNHKNLTIWMILKIRLKF